MRILVCGERDFDDYALLHRTLDEVAGVCAAGGPDQIGDWLPPANTVLIHGCAAGAATLADQ